MGIPKLIQDLLPYAEEIVLGCPPEELSRPAVPVIRQVVLDGPSIVYYVYSRLYPRCNSPMTGVDAQPSYIDITRGVVELLTALGSRQIEIKAIYFDGALPPEKQPVRLERLEKARAQLENYRKQCPGPFTTSTLTDMQAGVSVSESPTCERKLRTLGCTHPLPPPPFMVACVLDDLRNHSAGTYPVQVVPGEADSYCAAIARSTGAAILSNDSDMIMYDLGSEGSLVLLDTLDLALDGDINHDQRLPSHLIKAQRLYPISIARRMSLKMPDSNFSLLQFGFERARDPSASTGAIRSRCAVAHCREPGTAFERFCELYRDPARIGTAEEIASSLVQLDPRLSELYCQYNCMTYVVEPTQLPHIYMPLIVEDPTRDSSWAYGRAFRILAYSLLKVSAESTSNIRKHDSVIEFQRRGPRVAGVPLKLLDGIELSSSMEHLARDLRKTAWVGDALMQWRLFGFEKVNEEKARNGKPTIPLTWATQFLKLGYADGKLSWNDIHVYANMQAVLYSLWMLKQSCAVSKPLQDPQTLGDSLGHALRPLVSLRCLMASRWEIPTSSPDQSDEVSAEASGRADAQRMMPRQNAMDKNPASGSEPGTNHATSNATPTSRDRRRRANGNMFELLSPS